MVVQTSDKNQFSYFYVLNPLVVVIPEICAARELCRSVNCASYALIWITRERQFLWTPPPTEKYLCLASMSPYRNLWTARNTKLGFPGFYDFFAFFVFDAYKYLLELGNPMVWIIWTVNTPNFLVSWFWWFLTFLRKIHFFQKNFI